jgi:pimeloyl-ACP methyl ester carboxylesterase
VRVIAYDHPGYGLTDNPEDVSGGYRRDFVLKFMDALGLEKAALVAHSGSGGPSVELALRYPERILRVMILGTRSLLPPMPDVESEGGGIGDNGPLTEPTIEDARALLEEQLFHHELITPEVLDLRLRMALGKNHIANQQRRGAGRGSATQSTPLWQRLGEVTVPMLFLYGANDGGDPPKRIARARELYPTLEYQIADGCKHLVQWDAEEQFVALATRFLGAETPTGARAT